jgi:hypothetical protein
MSRLIHQLYYDGKITKEVANILLDKYLAGKNKRRYY